MSARAVGAFLVLALAGVGAGFGISNLQTEEPMTISVAAPVPAESPSYPMNEYDVEADPDDPALQPDLSLEETRLRAAGYKLDASVPKGWVIGGEGSQRTFSIPGSTNTYQLRIGIYVEKMALKLRLDNRIEALRDAEANEKMQNVVVESQTASGFVATYLTGGHRRVTMEQFFDLGTSSAYATVAVVGREVDREGMADLLERVSASLRVP